MRLEAALSKGAGARGSIAREPRARGDRDPQLASVQHAVVAGIEERECRRHELALLIADAHAAPAANNLDARLGAGCSALGSSSCLTRRCPACCCSPLLSRALQPPNPLLQPFDFVLSLVLPITLVLVILVVLVVLLLLLALSGR